MHYFIHRNNHLLHELVLYSLALSAGTGVMMLKLIQRHKQYPTVEKLRMVVIYQVILFFNTPNTCAYLLRVCTHMHTMFQL